MVKNYLLDTNIVIGLFANDLTIVNKISDPTSGIFIPTIVFGELFYGAELSSKEVGKSKKDNAFAQIYSIVECDIERPFLWEDKGSVKKTRDSNTGK